MEAGITISFTAMEAGITKVVTATYTVMKMTCFTSVESGITKVITGTYPVMLAMLSSSCNEETRTYSEVSRQLVYGHFVYDTSPTDISSTDISSTMTFLAEIEAGVMKRILYQENLDECKEFFLTRSGIDKNKRL